VRVGRDSRLARARHVSFAYPSRGSNVVKASLERRTSQTSKNLERSTHISSSETSGGTYYVPARHTCVGSL
jgi:hypothetical protein